MTPGRLGLGGAGLLLALSGCAADQAPGPAGGVEAGPGAPPSSSSSVGQAEDDGAEKAEAEAGPAVSDGRPRRSVLRIPTLGVRVPVVPYRGWTDDAPGTEIQDGGVAASPFGPRGGVGPGGVGNFQVTAHRTSSTRAFELLPDLRHGDRVLVDVGRLRYVYEVVGTRETSFRSPASLRAQRAAVPGRPGATPTRAMITLSTCATREDHAAGNFWSDEFHNPEHRIDKIGVLVAVRPR